jgi:hypothetical protein
MERMAVAHKMDRFFSFMGFYLFLVLGWDWWEMGNKGEELARLLVQKSQLTRLT